MPGVVVISGVNVAVRYFFAVFVLSGWPDDAHAVPFILMISGSSLLPFLGLLLVALLRNRRYLLIIASGLVGWVLFFSTQEQVIQQDYMRTESRIMETVLDEQRLVKSLRLQAADTSQAITSEQLRQIPEASRVWVKSLEQPLTPGMTLAQIASARDTYPADTVFVSFDSGWRSSLAAALTGARWLQGGIASLATHALSHYAGTVHETLPDCATSQPDHTPPCVRIGIHLSYQWIWGGFGRLAVDANLRIEEFLLYPDKALERIAQLTQNGNIPAVLVFFGSSGVTENRQWMAFLQDAGVQNASMLKHYDEVYDTLPEPLRKSLWVHNVTGDYRPELLPDGLLRLCQRGDVVLITAQTPAWDRITQYPQSLDDACPRINLPVEGLLPEEIKEYIQKNTKHLESLRSKRLVGLYLDAPGLFFATQLRDILSAEGYAWSGIVFGYNMRSDWLEPLHNLYDDILSPAYRAWPGVGQQIPANTLAAASFALLLLPLAGFVFFRRRGTSLLCFLGFVFLAGLVQQAFYRYPLAAWLEPLWIVAAALVLALVLAQIHHGLNTRPLTKARGLAYLRKTGLRTPPSLVLTDCAEAGLQRAVKKFGYPLIFRSNERRFENCSAATMGEYDSVVVRSADDWPRIKAAWDAMAAAPGAKPAWLVQPYMNFSASGVIRTGLVHDGCAYVRIESSDVPETVTGNQIGNQRGNQTGTVQSRLMSVESCRVSTQALLQQTARLADATQNAPALLEFGVVDSGINSQPVWLQYQKLPADAVLRYGDAQEAGYDLSPLDVEIQGEGVVEHPLTPQGRERVRGLPLLLSLLNASIPFKHWVLQGNRVWERSLPAQALFAALSKAIPWCAWLWASSRLLERARRHAVAGRGRGMATALWWARALLFLDSLVVLKGRSTRVVADDGSIQFSAFAHITSPYAAFGVLGALELTPENLTAPARTDQSLRCTADFLVRERLRSAIACALAQVSRMVQQRLRAQGLDAAAFDRITLADLKTQSARELSANPALVLADMDARSAQPADSFPEIARVYIHTADAIAGHVQMLQGLSGVIVRARSAWMGLFTLAAHVARFEIETPLAANSHFVQRARLLGIEVVSGATFTGH